MSEPQPEEPQDDGPVRESRGRRGRTATIYLALAAAGLTAGIVTGRITGSGRSDTATVRAGETLPSATPSITVSASPLPSPTPSPVATTVKPTPAPAATKLAPPDYSPIPADAPSQKGLDFGFLTGVQMNGNLVTISFDRAEFYTGKEATKENRGTPPDNDYYISNTSGLIRRFIVDTKAPLIGVNRLVTTPNGTTQQRLDAATFVTNATRALASGLGIPVWVRHYGGENGTVTSLAEQFIP